MKEKLKKCFQNGILYELLWEGNLFTKILYILIPFILILSFFLILYFRKAFVLDNGYGFLSDYSNCYMLGYIFIFIYFVNGLFRPFFYKQVDKIENSVKKYYQPKFKRVTIKYICFGASILFFIFSVFFISRGVDYGVLNWYSRLKQSELVFYSFLIAITWIISAQLFLSIIIENIYIYLYINKMSEKVDINNPDGKCGFKTLFSSLFASMGFGFYFLIAVAVIIFSDYNAHKTFNLNFLCYDLAWLIISVALILAVIYYSIILLTFLLLRNKIKKGIYCDHQNRLDNNACKKSKNITRFISINDIFVFLLSVLFPGIAAIIQIYISII